MRPKKVVGQRKAILVMLILLVGLKTKLTKYRDDTARVFENKEITGFTKICDLKPFGALFEVAAQLFK